jgi:quinol monooxygenase YgiN
MTVIIAGPVYVDPADRDRLVEGLRVVVERARQHPGCRDLSVSPDSLDAGRVNLFECWESQEKRGTGTGCRWPSVPAHGGLLVVSVRRA